MLRLHRSRNAGVSVLVILCRVSCWRHSANDGATFTVHVTGL